MSNIVPFSAGEVPAYALAPIGGPNLADGITGGAGINRISVKGGRFTVITGGVEAAPTLGPVKVVIQAFHPHVNRTYYATAYDPSVKDARPACSSQDGVVPDASSPAKQAVQCAACPRNVKGAAGRGTECSKRKRLVVTLLDDPKHTLYAIDVAALGIWGTDQAAQGLYNLSNYSSVMQKAGYASNAIVTALCLDSGSPVPKLMFNALGRVEYSVFRAMQAAIDPKELERYTNVDYGGGLSAAVAPAPTQSVPPAAQGQVHTPQAFVQPVAQPTPQAAFVQPVAQPVAQQVVQEVLPPETASAPAPAGAGNPFLAAAEPAAAPTPVQVVQAQATVGVPAALAGPVPGAVPTMADVDALLDGLTG